MDAANTPRTIDFPANPITKKEYRGNNVELLTNVTVSNKYPTNEWAGYRQWASIGRQVMKGQKATYLISVAGAEDGGRKKFRKVKVFNLAQTCEAAPVGVEVEETAAA